MKRMIKLAFLSSLLLISSLIFSQSALAWCGSCCNSCCNPCNETACSGPVTCFKTCSCSYDCCSGCRYKTITYWRSYCVRYKGYTCECGCPKCYTYAKRFSYPVKSVKIYLPAPCCQPCCQ
jgi:hypothetical protein